MHSTHLGQTTSIQELARGADYPARVLAAIVEISLAKDPPALLEGLMRATESIGASASVFTAAIPEDGSRPSCFSVFACHPAFAHEQSNRDALLDNPWWHFAQTHRKPGTNHEMQLQHAADAASMEVARQYGFRSCLVVPTMSGTEPARQEMLCLGSECEDDFEGSEARVVRALARSLASELHDWLTGHLRRQLLGTTQLRESDIRLLAMERRGLGTKEIAGLTGLSLASINSRFQRINTYMNCTNRKDSARRAAAYGLLEPL
ncbi:MAG: hypothetical protein JO006_07615 [Paucibacter sp.]|nr:hypothetical protein [Roseateles sp.]